MTEAGSTGRGVEFLVRFVRTGHAAGYPAADIEERGVAIAGALGFEDAQMSATPTMVDVALGALPDQRTFTLRVRPGGVDLDAIARLDDLAADLIERRIDVDAALVRLADIEAHPLVRHSATIIAAYALAGAALTPILGGGWHEIFGAAGIGAVVGAVALPLRRHARSEPLVAPLAAIAASLAATTLASSGVAISSQIVTLAALVTFLPGMTLTIGIQELSTEHLQSGVANTASALIQLVGLVFGVSIGRSVATTWFGPPHDVAASQHFGVAFLVAALVAGLAFTVTLRARRRDAWIMCSAAVLALVANELGNRIFGREAGAFVAALAVGVAGRAASAWLRRSSLVFIVPGILMLVPGSAGFNSVLQLLSNEPVGGVNAAADTLITAMSIAYGLLCSTLLLPARYSSVARSADRPW
jgi:uncharacterized membrane protein YjjP (DUF1212 family)